MDCTQLGSPDPQGFAIAMHISEKEGLSLQLFPFAQVPSSSEFNYKIVRLLELLFLLDVEKAREFQKTSISSLLTVPKPLTLWITINCGKFWEMGIPDHLTSLLRNLHAGQEATVRTGHGTTHWFQIGKGVRQGCILSPCLFNLYAEYIMRKCWPGWSTSWNQDCQEKCQ